MFSAFLCISEEKAEALGGPEEGRCHSSGPFKELLCSALSGLEALGMRKPPFLKGELLFLRNQV